MPHAQHSHSCKLCKDEQQTQSFQNTLTLRCLTSANVGLEKCASWWEQLAQRWRALQLHRLPFHLLKPGPSDPRPGRTHFFGSDRRALQFPLECLIPATQNLQAARLLGMMPHLEYLQQEKVWQVSKSNFWTTAVANLHVFAASIQKKALWYRGDYFLALHSAPRLHDWQDPNNGSLEEYAQICL